MKTAVKTKRPLPEGIRKIVSAIRQKFPGQVEVEPTSVRGRYRIGIVSDAFNRVPHMTRQDGVWDVVEATLGREGFQVISLILTYAPGELE